MDARQDIFGWLKAVEERGTDQEKELWLQFKDKFIYMEDEECSFIVYKDFINYENDYEDNDSIILESELFKNNLFLHYKGDKLEYYSDGILNAQPYCDQEFAIYRFDKSNKKTKFDILHTYFMEKIPAFFGYKDIYEEFNSFRQKVQNRSKNVLDMFMKNLDSDLVTNKNHEWEEFTDIIVLDNDGNSIYLLCENSDYYYFFLWEGS